MREKYSHSIHDSAGKEQRGKTQKFLCVKIRNRKESLCMRMNNSGEDEITVRGCSANSWSPRKCLRETQNAKSLCVRMNSNGEDANCKSLVFCNSWGGRRVCVKDEDELNEGHRLGLTVLPPHTPKQ